MQKKVIKKPSRLKSCECTKIELKRLKVVLETIISMKDEELKYIRRMGK